MNEPWTSAALSAGAFLSGSVPFGLLIGRAKGIDIRQHGSGNIGATNVGRVLGQRLGLACFVLDVLKGFVPVYVAGKTLGTIGQLLMQPVDSWRWLAVMVAAVLGHVYSPWIGFKGGKGVATALGALLGVFPILTWPALGAGAVWVVSLWVCRYVGLSSVIAAASLPVLVAAQFLMLGRGSFAGANVWPSTMPYLVVTGVLAALVIVKHRGNIRRVLDGTEPKVSWFGRARGTPQR